MVCVEGVWRVCVVCVLHVVCDENNIDYLGSKIFGSFLGCQQLFGMGNEDPPTYLVQLQTPAAPQS